MQRHPFVIGHPKEIARLFATGYINAPDGNKWNISFTPGIRGSWKAFTSCWSAGYSGFKESNKLGWRGLKHCLKYAKDHFKWGWNPREHGHIVKFFWHVAQEMGEACVEFIKTIPDGAAEGSDNISKLCHDAPFGWIPRIIKNAVWNCITCPILKFLAGVGGAIILTPGLFIIGSLVGIVGKWLIGNISGCAGVIGSLLSILCGGIVSIISVVGCGIASIFPLIGGCIVSTGVALGSITNRFPKPSDSGSYGLHIVIQPRTNV